MRVFFYVQYLEGIGHVVRASRIVEALLARGATVTLVLGGERVAGLSLPACEIVELPPLRASPESYSRLLRPDDEPVDATYETERRDVLLAAYERASPEVLLTEGYPMGRWAMEQALKLPSDAVGNVSSPPQAKLACRLVERDSVTNVSTQRRRGGGRR